MKLYGIIGYPLAHSFSKQYFTEKFILEGITGCRYENFPLSSIHLLPDLLTREPDLEGINITIPYKQEVIPFLTDSSPIPRGIDACNCIRISAGQLTGYNTDIIGFERSISPLLQDHHQHALILGNGGAAAAVKYVLQKRNIGFMTVSRQMRKGSDLTYADLTERLMRENTLIINTSPLGTYPLVHECPDIPYRYIGPGHLLFDLVYNPEKTLFLQKGEEQGAAIRNGYEMLVLQAEESWKIWTAF